jgi:chemotaxis protein methyltransferase CheR
MVRFETIDLRKSMRALGPFDLVFCRNVMIYFDAETKRNIMKELHGTLVSRRLAAAGRRRDGLRRRGWFERQTVGNATVYVAR